MRRDVLGDMESKFWGRWKTSMSLNLSVSGWITLELERGWRHWLIYISSVNLTLHWNNWHSQKFFKLDVLSEKKKVNSFPEIKSSRYFHDRKTYDTFFTDHKRVTRSVSVSNSKHFLMWLVLTNFYLRLSTLHSLYRLLSWETIPWTY